MSILVTGSAGFIGFFVTKALLEKGLTVIGIDNLNDYYDVNLKHARLQQLYRYSNFLFHKIDLADKKLVSEIFQNNQFNLVIHLAAQAGVRYSLINPEVYINSNISGFLHILEGCRHNKVNHLVYASSSSVYGANIKQPYQETDCVEQPLSLYGATKKANELMAHSYSNLYQLACTGLRFFTVYGPWGRPDMALFKFTKNIIENKPIDVYNHGNMIRDFTYIDDIVEGIIRISEIPSQLKIPYAIYNIGNNQPVKLEKFIDALEEKIGKKAIRNYMSIQAGDVPSTYANSSLLNQATGFQPKTSIRDGINQFLNWYLN